jgi:hypothetical protein
VLAIYVKFVREGGENVVSKTASTVKKRTKSMVKELNETLYEVRDCHHFIT